MILIDMEMPESCSKCQLLSEEVWCKLTGTSVWQNNIDYNTEKLPNCPLMPFERPLTLTCTAEQARELFNQYNTEPFTFEIVQ